MGTSPVLQKAFGRQHCDLSEPQFSALQIRQISGHDRLGISRDREFNQMIVGLVGKIWAPAEINSNPSTSRQKYIQQLVTFRATQSTTLEQRLPCQHVLVLGKQRRSHQRLASAGDALTNYPIRGTDTHAGVDKNIGIDHDSHFKMAALVPPCRTRLRCCAQGDERSKPFPPG